MEPWQMYLLAAGGAAALMLLWIRSAVMKKRKLKERDFDRRLDTLLQPKETIKVVCPQKSGHVVLTSRRLLFEAGEGFTAVPFAKIKFISGVTADGKKTVAPSKMVSVTIKAGQELTIYNTSENFVELVKELKKKTAKKKK